jgi:hypothetical protein
MDYVNYMLQLIISFLGGGILVAFISWARTSRSERAARKHEFVKEQVTKVYGPRFFFVGLTETLFALNDKFRMALEAFLTTLNPDTDICKGHADQLRPFLEMVLAEKE